MHAVLESALDALALITGGWIVVCRLYAMSILNLGMCSNFALRWPGPRFIGGLSPPTL
jgi:hypothetical protein